MRSEAESADPLRRRGSHALYGQLAERLLQQVAALPTGEQLPTELELMWTYDVSRTTVRRAVRALVDQGVLVRRQGKGTFVQRPDVTHSLDHLSPFFAVLSAAGRAPETEIVEFGWVSGMDVPSQLRAEQSGALCFRRLYLTDGRPHALLHVWISERLGRGVTREDVQSTPVLHLLERKHDLILRRAEYTIQSTAADSERARLLQIPVGAPLLMMNRLTRTAGGDPVELTTHYLDSSVYQLSVHLDEPSLLGEHPSWSLTHTVG